MTSVKKIKVALLALVAALVIAIPTSAFADTAVTAADTSLKVTAAEAGHVYDAYQVFGGDMAKTDDNKIIMSNVVWGTGIKADKGNDLVAAIKALGAPFDKVTSAADIAKALDGASDANVQAVAAIIGSVDDEGNAVYLNTATTLDKPAAANTDGKYEYTKTEVTPGYYFIQDRPGTLSGDTAYTRFMLQVVGAAEADAKADKPEVEKEVLEDNNNTWGKDAAWQTHEAIPYKITGTLPSNYSSFKGYYYVFTDRMSPGLTLNADSIKVYALNGTTETEITDGYTVDTTGTEEVNGETWNVMKVWFGDLQKATCTATIDKDTKIVVKYTANLNENAVVGNPGNPNDVKLKYANNPNKNGDGTPDNEPDCGETEWDHAIVFTFELKTHKNGVGADAEKLQGATFVLYRINPKTNAKEYAILDANNKVSAWTATKAEEATPLTSDANGNFTFKGLDGFKVTRTYDENGAVVSTTVEGDANKTYYLQETQAPTGYQLLTEPVKVTVTATYDQDKYDGSNATSIIEKLVTKTEIGEHVQDNIAGQAADGTYNAAVANTKGGGLPSTGGIGTTIFTIVGIALIVAAAAIMVIRRRNAAAVQ